MSTAEEYRDIPEWEDLYSISNYGNVRNDRTGHILSPASGRTNPLAAKKYARVTLSANGRQETRYLHDLVAEAWLGKRPKGHWTVALDGDSCNAVPSNLMYVPRAKVRQITQALRAARGDGWATRQASDRCWRGHTKDQNICRICLSERHKQLVQMRHWAGLKSKAHVPAETITAFYAAHLEISGADRYVRLPGYCNKSLHLVTNANTYIAPGSKSGFCRACCNASVNSRIQEVRRAG
jgi:hypothetical protein